MRTTAAIAAVFFAFALDAAAQACPGSRFCSTLGFSFEPPDARLWKTEFGRTSVQFHRTLNPEVVSMFAGAVEGKTMESYPGKDELLAFVRKAKSKWGPDGRYKNVKETFAVETAQESCVRYELYAEDTRASNLGPHPSLPTLSVGRFCLHPRIRSHAVDLYYSVRSVPGYRTADLEREGEVFLRSLQFTSP